MSSYLFPNQISLLHEEQLYRYNTELINDYIEQDLLERKEREYFIQTYRELDVEEET